MPKVEWTMTLTGEVEVLAPDASIITEMDDPSLGEAVRQAITLSRARVRRDEAGLHPAGVVSFRALPAPVGFDISWRAGGREWLVGSVAAPAAAGAAMGYGHDIDLPADFDARLVDIILRSNPQAATAAIGINEIWKGEVVFEGVEIEWPEDELPDGK
jgi:hypothetical protein